MRTPTWGEIERFCRVDGWRETRRTDHVFFERTLADGTVLQTHRSFASDKTMSPGRFKAILRNQLHLWCVIVRAPIGLGIRKEKPVRCQVQVAKFPQAVLRGQLSQTLDAGLGS